MRMSKRWILAALILALAVSDTAFGALDGCGEDLCPVPIVNEDSGPVYTVVSPVGYHAVEMISQAPRLDTLEGKKIALVGGSFMAAVTHDELKKCILEAYPTARVYLFEEVGNAGPYSVFRQSAQTVSFQKRLRELGIDAVIAGNCGCGLCTTKESGSAIAAEYAGVPAVTVGAPTFIAQIRSTGVNRGVPALRTAEYPGAFASHSEEELRRNTRQVLWPQIVPALTPPITGEEIGRYASAGRRPFDEAVYTGTFDEIQEFCRINGWTDGLPVVPPTDEAVREYLRFTPYPAEEILGVYPLAYRECAVYTAVANAVMAGVPKELTPVCVALTQALNDGEWRRPLASTHGWSPYAWLNGPLARQLGVSHDQGMISGQANKALGRFIDLMMLNLGGYYTGENRMGTFGYLTPFVFSEDEEACRRAGWTPYHASQGFSVNDNTVTAASALAWGNNVTPAADDPEQIMRLLAFDITEKQQNGLGNTNPQVYRTVLVTEPVAAGLAQRYADKGDLEDALIGEARRPLYMRAYAAYWANTGSAQTGQYTFEEYMQKLRDDPQEQAALTDTPDWMKGLAGSPQTETIAAMRKGQTAFLIAGDPARNKFMVLPGGGTVTVPIRLPENWDELVAPMGYEPLSRFELTEEAEKTEAAPERPARDSATPAAPAGLSDGEYRLVPSPEYLTGEGLLYRADSGAASAWAYGAPAAAVLPAEEGFAGLVRGLFAGCSLKTEDGRVAEVILRPAASGRKGGGDAAGLTAGLPEEVRVTLAVTVRPGRREGKATEDGAALTFSSRLRKLTVSMGGTPEAGADSTPSFLTLNGSEVTLNPKAQEGAGARIGVPNGDGTWRTLTFTKTDRGRITVEYRARDSQVR